MIWLASFPRSGNTFARNVLFQVYGLESTEVNHKSFKYSSTYREYPVVKTHMRPFEIPDISADDVVVYIVRDGRDALTSIAHHRTNIIDPGSDLMDNLKLAVEAQKGSYFGGWHINVLEWTSRADLVIRFEDLINDPIAEFEKLRPLVRDLKQPRTELLPTFESQKLGDPKYGPPVKTKLFFRKGAIGDWNNLFDNELHKYFWRHSGDTMELLGYDESGEIKNFNFSQNTNQSARQILKKKTSTLARLKQVASVQIRRKRKTKPSFHPKIIYFKAVTTNDQFENKIVNDLNDNEIVHVRIEQGDFVLKTPLGKPVRDQSNISVIISEVSYNYLSNAIDLLGRPTMITWLKHPSQHVLERFNAHQKSDSNVDSQISPQALLNNTEFAAFIRQFENRSPMSRVISKYTKLDIIGSDIQPKELSKALNSIGVQFDEGSIPIAQDLSHIHDFVMRYNRYDFEIYDYFNKHLNGKDQK